MPVLALTALNAAATSLAPPAAEALAVPETVTPFATREKVPPALVAVLVSVVATTVAVTPVSPLTALMAVTLDRALAVPLV